MREIIIWGTGYQAQKFTERLAGDKELYTDHVAAYGDNNESRQGGTFNGAPVIGAGDLAGGGYDYIVIAAAAIREIREQLISAAGVDPSRIMSPLEYERTCYAALQYRKRYSEDVPREKFREILLRAQGTLPETGEVSEKGKMSESGAMSESGEIPESEEMPETGKLLPARKPLLVYTIITGRYDNLKDPLVKPDNVTYVCVTNNRNIRSDVWNMEYLDETDDNLRISRYYKLFPEKLFGDFEKSIYVDGKFLILRDLNTYIDLYQKDAPMLSFPHYCRNCVIDEAAECIKCGNADKKKLLMQAADYIGEGLPVGFGLYENGCIVRKHHDPDVLQLMEFWWQELQRHTYRDQLSLPYAIWKSGIQPDICDLNIDHNPWLEYMGHNL